MPTDRGAGDIESDIAAAVSRGWFYGHTRAEAVASITRQVMAVLCPDISSDEPSAEKQTLGPD